MSARNLLIVTALAEAPTGLLLLVSPAVVVGLLLGTPLDAAATTVVARVAGAALLAVGVTCWMARDDGSSRAVRGLVTGLLLYNSAAVAVLAHACLSVGLAGIVLWPTVALHAALALWCCSQLLSRRR